MMSKAEVLAEAFMEKYGLINCGMLVCIGPREYRSDIQKAYNEGYKQGQELVNRAER